MRVAFAAIVLFALGGCETTNEHAWSHAGASGTSFDAAERTCEDQMAFVAEENDRPEFFVKCMAAFGWSPKRAGVVG